MLRRGWCGKTPSPCRHSTSPCVTPPETRVGREYGGVDPPVRPPKSRANIGFPANTCKLTQFSTSQIIGFVGIPPFVHYPQNLWKMQLTHCKRIACTSIRRMRFTLWRRGKECGLRVNQTLTNRRLRDRHGPAFSVAAIGATDRAGECEMNL